MMTGNHHCVDGSEHIAERYGRKNDHNEWWDGCPMVTDEFVCTIADALEPDDEVIINDRSRPVTVLGFEEQQNPGLLKSPDYPYHIVWLRGNGTEYRMRWSHRCEHSPTLHTESELETRESWSVKHEEKRQKTIPKSNTGEAVRWISVVAVDDDEIDEWAFARSIDGLEDYSLKADSDQ